MGLYGNLAILEKCFKSCKIGTTSVYTDQKTNQQAHSFLIGKVICM